MSERYFQNVMSEARERHPSIHYLSCTAEFKNDTSVNFSVHLSLVDPNKPGEFCPATYPMVHVMNSTRCLAATIDEAVRRVGFDNNLLLIAGTVIDPSHYDGIDNAVIESLESENMISEGSPA